ncbi:uncharacterized protein LOC117101161 [Anneissia japonica]|uniref:uncharacterized protein LOC117101161 n=1 Tax=Anneissia japonica TaxID=1529436 RepID=UPI001425AAF7|nr:uncharacterized protein LOC117101161 [Anneissia japonica]XP_033096933.1 uncharacterized protein LOC117101161 [Anneissia japonica]
MQSGGPLPERRDVLGDHLYSLVISLDVTANEAGQLTGMLLEMGNDKVLKMLQDKHLLQANVKEAQSALKRHTDCKGFENEELAEKLYQRIEDQEQENCAKLTGMLLELNCEVIKKLLSSNKELETAISKAKACLDNDENRSSVSDREKERIGDDLFDLVFEINPDFAAKITGMLLEMDIGSVKVLLSCPKRLKEKVDVAYKALMQSSS